MNEYTRNALAILAREPKTPSRETEMLRLEQAIDLLDMELRGMQEDRDGLQRELDALLDEPS